MAGCPELRLETRVGLPDVVQEGKNAQAREIYVVQNVRSSCSVERPSDRTTGDYGLQARCNIDHVIEQ